MQPVFICGGRGTRLGAVGAGARGPKSLLPVGGVPLLERLVATFTALAPGRPVFVHAAGDAGVPAWVSERASGAALVAQPEPDGVASAVLLALPHLEGPALVVLGDLFIAGAFDAPWPPAPAVAVWPEAPPHAVRRNFGVAVDAAGRVSALVEKPADPAGLVCGLGVYLLGRDDIASFASAPVDTTSGERQITAALDHVRLARGPLGVLRFRGAYVNVNSAEDQAEAEAAAAAAAIGPA
jgi:dTDP-glucose pyrophosphorylase